jgi:hypothetical protein
MKGAFTNREFLKQYKNFGLANNKINFLNFYYRIVTKIALRKNVYGIIKRQRCVA